MVNRILLFILLSIPLAAQAVVLDPLKQQLQLGEDVVIRIKTQEGEDLNKILAALPSKAWTQDFVVELHSNGINRATYHLYPYQTGVFDLEAGGIFKGAEIRVLPNPQVTVQWHNPQQKSVYQNQAWAWQLDIKLQDPSLRAKLLPFTEGRWQQNPQGLQVEVFKPALPAGDLSGALQAGYEFSKKAVESTIRIYSPVLEVAKSKGYPFKFFARPIQLQVVPLPGFLPEQVLLGQLQLKEQPLPNWGKEGDLIYWRWQVDAIEMNQQNLLQALQQQLASQPKNDNLEWFAPRIIFDKQKLGAVEVSIPLRLLHSGKVTLPSWQWRYFDIQSGKLELLNTAPQSFWVITAWQLITLYLVTTLLVLLALLLVTLSLRFYWLRWRLLQTLPKLSRQDFRSELWKLSESWLQDNKINSWSEWQLLTGTSAQLRCELEENLYAAQSENREKVLAMLHVELKRKSLDRQLLRRYLRNLKLRFVSLLKTIVSRNS